MILLGIDVGITGALAVIDGEGRLLDVVDMPCLQDGPAGRRAINAPLLSCEISTIGQCKQAFVEYVGPRPMEGAVGAFSFGRSKGIIEGVLAAHGISIQWFTPPSWKRIIRLPPGAEKAKDASRAEAIRRCPSQAHMFARVKDDGRADAYLIGLAGMIKTGLIP